MKKKSIIVFVIILIVGFIYHNFFSKEMIVGTYLNQGSDIKVSLGEIPTRLDTLIILRNNKFKNTTWGEGTYEISYSITGTKIQFIYDYEFGKAGFESTIDRSLFKSPRILLFKDLDYYYDKIK